LYLKTAAGEWQGGVLKNRRCSKMCWLVHPRLHCLVALPMPIGAVGFVEGRHGGLIIELVIRVDNLPAYQSRT
jgi:hypothetical protein